MNAFRERLDEWSLKSVPRSVSRFGTGIFFPRSFQPLIFMLRTFSALTARGCTWQRKKNTARFLAKFRAAGIFSLPSSDEMEEILSWTGPLILHGWDGYFLTSWPAILGTSALSSRRYLEFRCCLPEKGCNFLHFKKTL